MDQAEEQKNSSRFDWQAETQSKYSHTWHCSRSKDEDQASRTSENDPGRSRKYREPIHGLWDRLQEPVQAFTALSGSSDRIFRSHLTGSSIP